MPSVHRDKDTRLCGAITSVTNQSSVYVNDMLVAVRGDKDDHSGGGAFTAGLSNGVYVNGLLMVVVGDYARTDNISDTTHHNTNAKTGSDNVFAG